MWGGRVGRLRAVAPLDFALAPARYECSKLCRLHAHMTAGTRGTSSRRTLVSVSFFAYADVVYATVVVEGKVVRFKLSPALARAHRANRGKTITELEAVALVKAKRRVRALRRAGPDRESRR